MCRAAVLLAAAAAAFVSGCHTCPDHRAAELAFELAYFNYQNGKFDQAKSLYIRALENCPDDYDALVGLANASREYGNELFRAAHALVEQGKLDQARKMFQEANDNHVEAERFFRTAIQRHPDDMLPHYGLGQLFYQRAVTPFPFPYPVEDKENRRRERDAAIREFKLVVERGAHQLYQVHRYLGLALFAAGKMDEGRYHLQVFHEAQEKMFNVWVDRPAETDEEKKRKEAALRQLEREIEDVRSILLVYQEDLERRRDLLQTKSPRSAEDEQELARVTRELLALEGMLKSFVLTRLGPEEMELRRRCAEYLDLFNRGALDQILAQVAPRGGEEEAVRRTLRRKVEEGTQYTKVRFTTIAVAGEQGSVGVVCDLITRKGVRPQTELLLRWQRVGGRWMVSEHP
jgi:tetratricopeptide (TPR) repeat protein